MTPASRTLILVVTMLLPSCAPTADPEPAELSPKPLHTLAGHKHPIPCLDFSPDSKLLGSSCLGNKAIVWDATTGKEKARWVHGKDNDDAQVYAIRFHPKDWTVFTACWDGRVRIWEVDKKDPKTVLPGPFGVREGRQNVIEPGDKRGISKLVIDSTGTRMITEVSSYNGPVLWDLKAGKPKLLAESEVLEDVAFSPDGKRFIVAHMPGQNGARVVNVWDTSMEKVVGAIKVTANDEGVTRVCYSPDGKWIAGGGLAGKLWVWDAEKFIEVALPERHSHRVMDLQFTPDSKYLLSCAEANDDGPAEASIWDVSAKKRIGKFTVHSTICWSLAISPNGKLLATGAADGEIRLWDLAAILERLKK